MKWAFIVLVTLSLAAPAWVFAESLATSRIEFSIEETGNWVLTDLQEHITWRGEWIRPNLMMVTGSDGSCFILGENHEGMVKLDCPDLSQTSIRFSYTVE